MSPKGKVVLSQSRDWPEPISRKVSTMRKLDYIEVNLAAPIEFSQVFAAAASQATTTGQEMGWSELSVHLAASSYNIENDSYTFMFEVRGEES